MRTLVIAPHFDDEAISCAGLIAHRTCRGNQVTVMAMHGRRYADVKPGYQKDSDAREQADFFKSVGVLNAHGLAWTLEEGEPQTHGYYKLLGLIEEQLRQIRPHEVIIPSHDDLNQDHRHLAHVCQIALRPINLGFCHRVLEFAALDGRVRQPSYFVALTRSDFLLKLCAINCYRREAREVPSPRAPENVEAQARVWGAVAGVEYAEGYTPYLQKE